jgi:gliding motility-associated-like protein
MRIMLLLLGLAGYVPVAGQNFLMDGTPVSTCQGTFYDSGGNTGNYGNSQNFTTVICPGTGAGNARAQLSFSGIALAQGDALCLYDGNSTLAPLLACGETYPGGVPFIIRASAANTSGCLTAAFTSTAAGTAAGWAATIQCVTPCQPVEAVIAATLPDALPTDTGWIDICPGETVSFAGRGVYPQNGLNYTQSDATSHFEWHFGDGDITTRPATTHRYTRPGGYTAKLFITDVQGCRSTTLARRRIRVAPPPVFRTGLPLANPVCAGDTLAVTAAIGRIDLLKNLSVLPGTAAFQPLQSRADSLALPDGVGTAYEAGIFLTDFGPGQILTNINDLEKIYVNIEHSWARDLEIELLCPNGQSALLHNFVAREGNRILLGEPNDNDVVSPVPGKGYDYCWVPTAPQPAWLTVGAGLGQSGTLPPGNYQSASPLSSLTGCPLNGEWRLRITDQWQSDNGFIFSWGLQFKNNLYRKPETFTSAIQTAFWQQRPSLLSYSVDALVDKPRNAGVLPFKFTVSDAFGCTWDTTLVTTVLPHTHPSCHRCNERFPVLRDTVICANEPVQLRFASTQSDTFLVQFDAFPDYRFNNVSHPPANPYSAPLSISYLGYNTLINPVLQIKNICVDINTDRAGDLALALRAPDGKTLELSSNNGGSGSNYTKTCFSPLATNNILGAPAPLTGFFQPEGNWSALTGAPVNGVWQLLVSDADGPEFGLLRSWSMAFEVINPVTYAWSASPNLSCYTCPNPIATPVQNANYTATATDAFGCVWQDNAAVRIKTLLEAPQNIEVRVFGPDYMTWHWDAVPGAIGYEVRTSSGSNWQTPNAGLTAHTVRGLIPGDRVDIEVRAISGNASCAATSAAASQRLIVCTLAARVDSLHPVRCAGGADGSAFIGLQNGQAPFAFFVNGASNALSSGQLTNLFPAGNHVVIIRDGTGCRDTVNFVVAEPLPIIITSATATAARCSNERSGTVTATATGGTGILQYAWRACTGGPVRTGASVSNLAADCYNVTVTDANGCTTRSSATISEPPGIQVTITTDSVSCFGFLNGRAVASVSGGVPGYRYQWGNNTTTSVISNLGAGVQTLRVLDANNCAVSTTFVVEQPSAVISDSIVLQQPLCRSTSNGSMRVFPSGGNGPYQYIWSNQQMTATATGLAAGTYTVTITDRKNCPFITSATISDPTPVSILFSDIQPEKCVNQCDGAARVMAAGGTPPYTLVWDDVALMRGDTFAQNLCAGRFPVQILDKNACSAWDTLVIQAPSPLTLGFNSINPSCANAMDGQGSALVNGGQLPYQYLWSNGATTANVGNLTCGEYIVTVTDANACTISDTLVLSCQSALSIANIQSSPVRCFGTSSGELIVTPQGGTQPYFYLWSDPNKQADSSAMNLAVGTYTVTVRDARGCTATATETVTQPDSIVIRLVATNVRCFGETNGQVEAVISGGRRPFMYEWSTTSPDSVLINLPTGNYSLTLRDANGCAVSAPAVTISQPPTPISATAIQTKKACFGTNDGQALARGSGGVGSPYTFVWNTGQQDSLITNLSPDTFSVTVSDIRGCSDTTSIVLEKLTQVKVTLLSVPASCHDSSDGSVFINVLEGGDGKGDSTLYTYLWSVPAPLVQTYLTGVAGGTYFLTVTDRQGCSAVNSIPVGAPRPLQPSVQPLAAACYNTATGSIQVTQIEGGTGAIRYAWSNGFSTKNISGIPAGTYTLLVRDANNCEGTASATVTEPTPLAARFEASDLRCSGDTSGVINAFASGGTPDYQFAWSNGRSGASIRGLTFGRYAVTITDKNGCNLIDTAVINRPDSLDIQAMLQEPLCFGGDNGRITLSVRGGTQPYRYSIGNGPWGGSPVFFRLKAGDHLVRVVDFNGCISSQQVTLGQPPDIVVELSPDTTLLPGDSLLIVSNVSNTMGTVRYAWQPSLVTPFTCADPPECSEIEVKPLFSSNYQLVVTDARGCTGQATIRVVVEKPRGVLVPTGFSPNQDGQNDLLIVHGIPRQVQNIRLFRVYDRWGELVYEDRNFPVNDATRGWDGTFRNAPCQAGLFVWTLEAEYLDGFVETLSGEVMLLR